MADVSNEIEWRTAISSMVGSFSFFFFHGIKWDIRKFVGKKHPTAIC